MPPLSPGFALASANGLNIIFGCKKHYSARPDPFEPWRIWDVIVPFSCITAPGWVRVMSLLLPVAPVEFIPPVVMLLTGKAVLDHAAILL